MGSSKVGLPTKLQRAEESKHSGLIHSWRCLPGHSWVEPQDLLSCKVLHGDDAVDL